MRARMETEMRVTRSRLERMGGSMGATSSSRGNEWKE